MESEPVGPATKEASQPRSRFVDTWWGQTTATSVAAVVGAVVGGLVVWSVPKVFDSSGSAAPRSSVSISEVDWPVGHPSQYEVKGSATNLKAGEVLWVFNQDYSDNLGQQLYPSAGPCFTNSSGHFDCSLGTAGSNTQENDNFNVIVAIVTDEQGYHYSAQVTDQEARTSATTIATLAHVDGQKGETWDDYLSRRTN